MKKLIATIIIALFIAEVNAQIPNIGKVKLPKGKEKSTSELPETTTGNPANPVNTGNDEDEQTEMAYFFNDKNAELNELNNQYPEKMHYQRAGYFSAMLMKFNAQNVLSKIAEAEKKWPGTYNSDFWVSSQLKPAIADYNKNLIQTVNTVVDRFITESNQLLQEGNKVKALEVALYADSLSVAVGFSAGKELVKDLLVKTNDQLELTKNAMAKNYSSDYHKASAGTMKFSGYPVTAGTETGSQMKSIFTDGEKIFAMIYLHGQLKDYCLNDRGEQLVFVNIIVNNDTGHRFSIPVNEEALQKAYLQLPLICMPDEASGSITGKIIQSFVARLQKGNNNVEIEFLSKDQYLGMEQGSVMRTGFILNGESGFPELTKMNEDFIRIEVAKARVPKPVITNTSLESDMKRISRELFEEEITPLRASLQENWSIEYQENGTPYLRYMRGVVAFKVNRTGKCYYRMMLIGQNYEGAGTYGASYLYDGARPYDLVELECTNVNK